LAFRLEEGVLSAAFHTWRVKWSVMADDAIEDPKKAQAEAPPVDWENLRAQAAKLGITLSQLQQQQREKKLRLARKEKARAPGRQGSTSN
jgi:hypothetical protein